MAGSWWNPLKYIDKATGGALDDAVGGLKNVANTKMRGSDVGPINPGNFQLQGQQQRGQSLLQQADFAAGRGAPQIAGSQFRQDQRGLVDMLRAQAQGQGPSLAGNMLRDAMGRNVSNQQALLATGGPGGARTAAQQASMQGASIANQAANARIQEQMGALNQLGGAIGQGRGQDLALQQARANTGLQSRQLNDQQLARLREMELRNAQLGLEGSMGLEQLRNQRRGQDLNVPGWGEGLMGAAAGLLGSIG